MQCRRQGLTTQQTQALKRSYGEAKDAVRHHEAEIQSLQARLSSAAAELTIKEQALAKLKGDLKLEQDKAREHWEEWQHSKAALSGQLQASEQKLKSAEALLLEKTQELRDLETQQALQRDRQKEVQRLQERIADLSQQLSASEQAQRLMEEKLQRNYELLLESCEKEKQVLLQNLKEVEDKASAYEDQLQDHEQQMEVLQKEKLSASFEGSQVVQQLEEQLQVKEASIQTLAEHVQSLRDERDLIRQRFQELMERITLSDGDVAELQEKLRGREADYQSLEHSYRSVASQLQGMHTLLKEKEEELKRIKGMHEKVLEKKDQDLNEALVKMVALGNSLEETEMKLQTKEEILRKFTQAPSEEAEEPQSSLEGAEDGTALSGPQLQATSAPPGFPHLRLEDEDPGAAPREKHGHSSPRREVSMTPPKSEAPDKEGHLKNTAKFEQGAPSVKRQRIRFSTIQCQKYTHPDGSEKTWTSSTSDTSQDRSPTEESVSSEATRSSFSASGDPNTYLSIVHSLETKLCATEEQLKDVTEKLERQQGRGQEALLTLHQQWAGTEARLREQLRTSLLQVGALASQLEQEKQARAKIVENHVGELGNFQVKNTQALACLENCREQLRSLPGSGQEEAQEAGAGPLASVESVLVSAIQALRQWPAPADSGVQAQLEDGGPSEEGEEVLQQPPCQPELTEEQQLQVLSDQITLEASLINQIADSLKNTTSDISLVLHEISQLGKLPLETGSATVCLGAPADTWAKKVLVDGEFWSQVESLSKHLEMVGGEAAGTPGGRQQSIPQALVPALADATWVRAELSFAVQSVRESFHRRLQSIQEALRGTQAALQQHKHMLGEILGAYQTPDFERVMQQVSEALKLPAGIADGIQASWDLSPLGEELSHQDAAGFQEPFHLSDQSSGALVAIQEELALQLKEKAGLLGEIAASLTSLAPVESVRDCQKLLQVSRNLSCNTYLGGLGQYSSLLVKDAIIQAQVCYAACKIRLEYEKELQCYKQSWQSRGASCQEHERAVGALREEYRELLRKQKSEYLEVIAIIQRENAELKAQVTQLDQQQRYLEEVESKHSENMFALQGRYEEEIRCVVEQLNRAENTLQAEHSRVLSQLDASVRDRQDMERHHVEQMQTLEDKFQLKVKELQTIHEEELRTLQEHYSQNLQCLQETLCHYQGQPSEALLASSPHQPTSSTWPADQPKDALQVATGEADSMTGLRERIQELEAQMDIMREELEHKDLEGNTATLREKYQKDFENLKVLKHCLICKTVERQAFFSSLEGGVWCIRL